ncbi:hypothetical protein BDY17DRAFT_72154 [Neohortaea acidophila]|uniref:Uncharacterized protein n=1 Tax=Neohortaea acidophila TaxID=245834 RepID=A0A6A6Q3D2_9PEZI|nr:uncharacterized protein BDY17DRAFT_72154 [Neohortaea acidophila]KAF2486163.1 hypothetical protein BDY17DRAFT_72154 [Neohortaea acidophila]
MASLPCSFCSLSSGCLNAELSSAFRHRRNDALDVWRVRSGGGGQAAEASRASHLPFERIGDCPTAPSLPRHVDSDAGPALFRPPPITPPHAADDMNSTWLIHVECWRRTIITVMPNCRTGTSPHVALVSSVPDLPNAHDPRPGRLPCIHVQACICRGLRPSPSSPRACHTYM